MAPCRFFLQGRCTRGWRCGFDHQQPKNEISSPSLRAAAATFVPRSGGRTLAGRSPAILFGTPCRFFAKGYCANGEACRYRHIVTSPGSEQDVATGVSSSHQPNAVTNPDVQLDLTGEVGTSDENEPRDAVTHRSTADLPVTISKPQDGNEEPFDYKLEGAAVQFGSGVEVLSLRVASDRSAVHIENMPADITPQRLSDFLNPSGYHLPTDAIRIKVLPDATATAHLQRDDPNFAQRIVDLYDSALFGDRVLKVRATQATEQKGSSLNTTQMSTVVCSWYKSSRVAWAHYQRFGEAKRAQQVMNGKWIDGRKMQCSFQEPSFFPTGSSRRHMKFSVQIGNLAPSTTSAYLRKRFRSAADVVMGKLSYESSTQEVAELVQSLLRQVGNLESFNVNSFVNPRFEKALAKFSNPQEARVALQKFGGYTLPEVKSKLFLSLLVSVKFKVLRDLFRAVETQLNDLRIQVLAEDHITVKTYQSNDRTAFLTLRVYGEDAKAVGKAKSSIETILAGTLAKKQDGILWDDFFLKPEGLAYLKQIQEKHGAFIYRDARRRQFSLYGSLDTKDQVLDVLVKKINGFAEQSHQIILTPTTRRRVFQGGLQEISRVLGEGKAGLHITPNETMLNVRGSEEDMLTAKAILEDHSASFNKNKDSSTNTEAECSVCWTEADDAYRTSCGHTYCKECFSGLCASATNPESFPLKCLGDATRCAQVFGMVELQTALSQEGFDDLMKAAVHVHIRTRPNEYQYCVTADCPQVYRITTNGRVFDCPSCLTPICTTCQAVSHDGSTCEEYKNLSSEGSLAFKKWMEENKVKPCPNCGAPIQKSYGCNHMTCTGCSTHFCWFCMEVCGPANIYDHMRNKHGNIGIEPLDNFEDEAVEVNRLRRMRLD